VADTSSPLLTERFDDALGYASALHRTQLRKGSNIPYVSHLLGVASLALEFGADEDQAIAALLHDAVEDQGGAVRLGEIRDRYGETVAAIVADCTDDLDKPKGRADKPEQKRAEWEDRKRAYLATLDQKRARSLLVSIADKTHNASAINADLREAGSEVWDRFTGGKEGTLWYYRRLADIFAEQLPGPASARLQREVAEMEQLARSC